MKNEKLQELVNTVLTIKIEQKSARFQTTFCQLMQEISLIWDACYDEEIDAEAWERHQAASLINELALEIAQVHLQKRDILMRNEE